MSPYGYYYPSAAAGWAVQFFLGILGVVLVLASLVGLVFYVLQSVALYQIAQRRCVKHAWLAWIPVGRAWLLGSLSDQYQYVVKGKVRNFRLVLLILAAVSAVLRLIVSMGSFSTYAALFSAIVGMGDPSQMQVVAPVVAGGLAAVFNSVVYIAYLVLTIIVLYDVFESCNPGNAVVYLILGIIFPFLRPIFIFACRKQDMGMPPRKTHSTPIWDSGDNNEF